MKVLFILPTMDASIVWHQGVGILSAVLKQNNFKVSLIELTSKDYSAIIKKIRSYKPRAVLISTNTHMFPYTKEICHEIKKAFKVPIFAGGIHAVLNPQSIGEIEADGMCIGEGEKPLIKVLKALDKGKDYTGTENFWFKKNGQIIKNPVTYFTHDLNELPDIDVSVFKYFQDKKKKIVPRFIFSRGCPFQCTYCCNHKIQEAYRGLGKYVRYLSVDRAVSLIEATSKQYSFDHVVIDDDTVTLNRQWIIEFCQKYRQRINKSFECNVRVETADYEVLSNLKEAGCNLIKVGVETGSERLRKDVLKRFMTNKQIINVFKIAGKLSLQTFSFNMVGIPGETTKTISQTINLNRILKPDKMQTTIFYPYPGTALGDYCLENNMVEEGTLTSYYTESILSLKTISRRQLLKAKRLFRYNVYKTFNMKKALLARVLDSKTYSIVRYSAFFKYLVRVADKFDLYRFLP